MAEIANELSTEFPVIEPFQAFRTRVPVLESGKKSIRLTRSDLISAAVQVVGSGGETNLHSHAIEDEIWFILSGKAKFYTTDDQVVAELEKFDGLLIPRGTPYWFESASPENLVIMRFGARLLGTDQYEGRVDFTERTFAVGDEEGPRHAIQVVKGQVFGE